MSQKYYTILTKLGAELLANATVLGTPLKLTQIAVGDANGSIPNPIATQTSLVHEVRRAAINTLFVDKDNPNQLIAEQVIPETEGGWFIHEIGLYDDKGNLIAVGNCPSTYKPKLVEGSARTQVIRMVIVIDDVNAVELKIDPSVVLATRQYVDELITTKMANHEKSTNHPDATTKSKGFVQLNSATNSTAENQAATPLAIKTVNENANSRVPNIRKINNKMLNNDILLQADDINALPAFRKIINNEPIYEVGEQTNFKNSLKSEGVEVLTKDNARWYSRAIGEMCMFDDIDAPPTNLIDCRYIKLSINDSYNGNILTNQLISGTAPLITSTGVIDLVGSKLHGKKINLINTENRYIVAGTVADKLRDDAIQNISGMFRTYTFGNANDTQLAIGAFQIIDKGLNVLNTSANNEDTRLSEIIFNAYLSARTDTSTHGRDISKTFYMRIL